MTQPLNADALIEKAMKDTGIDAFDCDSYREGLDVFVNDFNKGIAKGYHIAPGIERAAADSVHYLSNRLRVAQYHRDHPELASTPIERPVFVMGVPRTGTTLLSNLLACDPARRSPLEWEIDEPVPPATTATLKTDPRVLPGLRAHLAEPLHVHEPERWLRAGSHVRDPAARFAGAEAAGPGHAGYGGRGHARGTAAIDRQIQRSGREQPGV